MIQKNNARHVAKQSRAKAESISDLILAHQHARMLADFLKTLVFVIGLWAFIWLMYFAFGPVV